MLNIQHGLSEIIIKWHAPLGLDFGLGLWRLYIMVVQVERLWEFMAKGLDFGLGFWEASHHAQLKAPLPIFYWLFPFLWTLNKVWPLNPTTS
jgi:hypothetical protein